MYIYIVIYRIVFKRVASMRVVRVCVLLGYRVFIIVSLLS